MKTKSNKKLMNWVDLEQKFIAANLNDTKTVQINCPVPYEFDLFGETSVTISEVILWVESVTIYDRHSPRFDWYVKNWDVVGKIKRVKQQHPSLEAYFIQDAANDARY